MKTKEYPENGEIVINEIEINYSQESQNEEDQNLKLSIENQGAGFYYVIKTDKWAFEKIDDLVKILEDFKIKSNIT